MRNGFKVSYFYILLFLLCCFFSISVSAKEKKEKIDIEILNNVTNPYSEDEMRQAESNVKAFQESSQAAEIPKDKTAVNGDINEFDVSVSEIGVTYKGDMGKVSNKDGAWNTFFTRYRTLIVGLAGMGTITMILFFIMNFTKLGVYSGNPQERQKVINSLILSGIATMILGSITLFVAIFYFMFR